LYWQAFSSISVLTNKFYCLSCSVITISFLVECGGYDGTWRIMKLPLPHLGSFDNEIVSDDICVPESDHLSCSDHDSNLEISADDVCDELSDKVYADCAPPLQMTSENGG
jgi:hypothetical protein